MARQAHPTGTKPPRPELTSNQRLVIDLLRRRRSPTTAYDILDALREKGFRAPPQAYRALERLRKLGMVHRVDSLNAFVACCQSDNTHQSDTVVLSVCTVCHGVTEMTDPKLRKKVTDLSSQCHLRAERLTVELRGCCLQCDPPDSTGDNIAAAGSGPVRPGEKSQE